MSSKAAVCELFAKPSRCASGRTSGSCPLVRVSCSSRGVAFFRSPSLAAVTAEPCARESKMLHPQGCSNDSCCCATLWIMHAKTRY